MKNNSKDQYDYFVSTQKAELNRCIEEVHNLYIHANKLYDIIIANKEYLKFIKAPVDKIEKLNNRYTTSHYQDTKIDYDDDPEVARLKSNIHTYSNILVYRIPKLQDEIKFRTLMYSMPYKVFLDFYRTLNTEIAVELLLGNRYYIPLRVGDLQVFNYSRDFTKKSVDFGKTNKHKKETGETHVFYHLDDKYTAPRYVKTNAAIKNYKYYLFKFNKFINTKSRSKAKLHESITDIDDILYNNKLGNWDKMLAIKHIDKSDKRYNDYDRKIY